MGDPYWAPPPARPFADEVNAEPGRLKIAFSVNSLMGGTLHEECLKAVKDTADLCSNLGHEIVETGPELSREADIYEQAFTILWFSSCVSTIDTISHIGGFAPDAVSTGLKPWPTLIMADG
ncbi:MAG: hypothetical protein JRF32_11425 [Deltaproteobacteria bacterium]|nr:hypothetical protein [Deltaproteobacteria bacterium]